MGTRHRTGALHVPTPASVTAATRKKTFRALRGGVTVARLGIVDAQSGALEIQGEFTVSVDELREASEGTMKKYFG